MALTQRPEPSLPDPRNAGIRIYVNGAIVPREAAAVSVFDSVVQGGDAVWEGLRVYDGKIAELDAHLDRLLDSAHAMAFAEVPSRETIKQALFDTLEANGMRDDVHIRLTLTRGKKVTSGMNPTWNQYGPTLIVLPEWKPPIYRDRTLRLITSSIRRNNPQSLDSKIHHSNLINNILAKIEANHAGADGAVMLDLNGFVAEVNGTNLFIVRRGEVLTPHADSCLPGITRGVVLRLARENGIPAAERNLSMADVYTADEVFATGTEGELAPVEEVDGRRIRGVGDRPVTRRLQQLYTAWIRTHGEPLPF